MLGLSAGHISRYLVKFYTHDIGVSQGSQDHLRRVLFISPCILSYRSRWRRERKQLSVNPASLHLRPVQSVPSRYAPEFVSAANFVKAHVDGAGDGLRAYISNTFSDVAALISNTPAREFSGNNTYSHRSTDFKGDCNRTCLHLLLIRCEDLRRVAWAS